jgi:hypothetical protein
MAIKIPMSFFAEMEKKVHPKIHIEESKTPNNKSHPEKKEKDQRYQETGLQIILQSHSNQDSRVLAQKRHKDQ